MIGYAARRRCRAFIENLPIADAAPYSRDSTSAPLQRKSIGAEAEAGVDRKKVAGSAANCSDQ
jgi:hypothetical protein